MNFTLAFSAFACGELEKSVKFKEAPLSRGLRFLLIENLSAP
jgi:hypothetical protein